MATGTPTGSKWSCHNWTWRGTEQLCNSNGHRSQSVTVRRTEIRTRQGRIQEARLVEYVGLTGILTYVHIVNFNLFKRRYWQNWKDSDIIEIGAVWFKTEEQFFIHHHSRKQAIEESSQWNRFGTATRHLKKMKIEEQASAERSIFYCVNRKILP
jgi:hypothetical protein